MKTDCIHIDICALPIRLCNDDCEDYEGEGINPFQEAEDRGCAEYHFKKDMEEI